MDQLITQPVEFVLPAAFAGRFTLLRKVGSGGMGETYLSQDHLLNRKVVLKRVLPAVRGREEADDRRLRSMLLSEAKRACAINSPFVAQIYDVLQASGELMLVIEYIEGKCLREILGPPMAPRDFLTLAMQLAEAVRASHAAAVLHCDLKPENILLDKTGAAKVIDFGLARLLTCDGYDGETVSLSHLEKSVCGTPGYIAPELLREQPASERSDIFALGVVFYEILTGTNPFHGPSFAESVDRTLNAQVPSPSRANKGIPPALGRTVMKMLERDPAQRLATASEVLLELQKLDPASRLHPREIAFTWELPSSRGPYVRNLIFAVLCLALLLPLGWFALRKIIAGRPSHDSQSAPHTPAGTRLLVVLPFEAIGNDSKLQAYGEGLRRTITSSLLHTAGPNPVEVLAASEFRDHPVKTAAQARVTYGADLVVVGSLEPQGSNVRVNYDLVDTRTRHPIESAIVTSSMDDPFALEDRIVNGVLHMLAPDQTSPVQPRTPDRGTLAGTAYEQYLQGLGYLRDFDDTRNNERALNSFKHAVEADPNFVQAYAQLGLAYWNVYLDTKDTTAIEHARDSCGKALQMKQSDPSAQVCLATIAIGSGHPEQAVTLLNRALATDPRDDIAMRDLANAYEKLGDPTEAARVYEAAVKQRPQYWANYYYLANFYQRQARYADALKALETALPTSPTNSLLYTRIGVLQYFLGRYDDAITSLERALTLQPNPKVYLDLGEVYLHKQQYDRAAEAFESALRGKPNNLSALADLADAEHWNPDPHIRARATAHYQQAATLARAALQVDPRSVDALLVLAYSDAALGQKAESQRSLRLALTHAPEDAEVLMYAARTAQRSGDSGDALKWLGKAINRGYSREDIASTPDFALFRGQPSFDNMLRYPPTPH